MFRNETYPSQEKPSKSKPKDLKKEINNTLVNVSNTTRKKIKLQNLPGMHPVPKKLKGTYKKNKETLENVS